MGGINEFFENFERNKHFKKLPSVQRVKRTINKPAAHHLITRSRKVYCQRLSQILQKTMRH